MGFKKEKKTITYKGEELKAIIEKFTKIDHSNTQPQKFNDYAVGKGQHGDYVILIDSLAGLFSYVPSCEIEGITEHDTLDQINKALDSGNSITYTFEKKKAKDSGRDYFIMNY